MGGSPIPAVNSVVNRYVLPEGREATVFIGVEVECPNLEPIPRRAVCFLVDASFSMGREGKLETAKQIVSSLTEVLGPTDLAALVSFATRAEASFKLQKVRDPNLLLSSLGRIRRAGSTNLHAGLLEATKQMERSGQGEPMTRTVVLVSDGVPTLGPRGIRRFREIARQMRAAAVHLIAIGVGERYNERLMLAMAEENQGHWYHVEGQASTRAILPQISGMLGSTVLPNVSLEIRLMGGARIGEAFTVQPSLYRAALASDKNPCTCYLGDLARGTAQTVMFSVHLPARPKGEYRLAHLSLKDYHSEADVIINLTDDPPLASQEVKPKVRLAYNLARTISVLRDARLAHKIGPETKARQQAELLLGSEELGSLLPDVLLQRLVANLTSLLTRWSSRNEQKAAIQETMIMSRGVSDQTRLY